MGLGWVCSYRLIDNAVSTTKITWHRIGWVDDFCMLNCEGPVRNEHHSQYKLCFDQWSVRRMIRRFATTCAAWQKRENRSVRLKGWPGTKATSSDNTVKLVAFRGKMGDVIAQSSDLDLWHGGKSQFLVGIFLHWLGTSAFQRVYFKRTTVGWKRSRIKKLFLADKVLVHRGQAVIAFTKS